jgi:hypothetical protein
MQQILLSLLINGIIVGSALAQAEPEPSGSGQAPPPVSPIYFAPAQTQSLAAGQMQVILARISELTKRRQLILSFERRFKVARNSIEAAEGTSDDLEAGAKHLGDIMSRLKGVVADERAGKLKPDTKPFDDGLRAARAELSKLRTVFIQSFGKITQLLDLSASVDDEELDREIRTLFSSFSGGPYRVRFDKVALPYTHEFGRTALGLWRSKRPQDLEQLDEALNNATRELAAFNQSAIQGLLERVSSEYTRFADDADDFLDQSLRATDLDRQAAEQELAQLNRVASRQGEINEKLVWAVYGMILAIVVLFCTLRMFQPTQISHMIESRTPIELLSMGFLLLTIIILGTGRLINSEGLSTILGAIAGYIFGRESDRRRIRLKGNGRSTSESRKPGASNGASDASSATQQPNSSQSTQGSSDSPSQGSTHASNQGPTSSSSLISREPSTSSSTVASGSRSEGSLSSSMTSHVGESSQSSASSHSRSRAAGKSGQRESNGGDNPNV